MSWYRTYRPQQVKDLHIKPVREALLRILALGEFDHAYLLAGPKGTGKTSAARILAKVLNCVENKALIQQRLQATDHRLQKKGEKKTVASSLSPVHSLKEPCNECASCIAITNGSSLTVNEIDAASNRGIDDIRALRERIGFAPADGLMSVYIIDEVHMLTTESFNALLKILEEPPLHVVFVLATTDPQKMPATVISRCTLISYRKATTGELKERLQQIAAAEHISVSDSILERIALAADGSFRDCVKLFEQIAKGKETLKDTDVNEVVGSGTGRFSADLLSAMLAKKSTTVLDIFQTIADSGMDGILFQKEVLTVGHGKLVEFAKASDPRFSKLLSLLQSIAIPIEPLAPVPWLPFELACLQYVQGGTVEATGNPTSSHPSGTMLGAGREQTTDDRPKRIVDTQRDTESGQKIESRKLGKIEHSESSSKPPAEEKKGTSKQVAVTSEQQTSESEQETGNRLQATEQAEKGEVKIDTDYATIQSKWPEVLAKVRSKSVPMDGILRATRLVGLDGRMVCIEASYQFHKEQLELVRNRTVLEGAMQEIFGQPLRLQITLGILGRPILSSKDHNISGKVEDEGLIKAAEDAFL